VNAPAETPPFADGSELLEGAYATALYAHHGPAREGDTDIDHPVAVAAILDDAGYDDDVVAAALLHDVLEDTHTRPEEIRERFGERIGALVEALTEDRTIQPYEARKAAHREQVRAGGADAAAIFAADKLASVRRLRRERGSIPAEKLDHYTRTLSMLRESYPDLPLLGELARELAALARAQ
jgi:(p)ppGpp synthase/HD superfamily hydrolase